MQLDRVIRWVLTLGVLLLAILVLGVVLYLTESFFAVWDRLMTAPRWLLVMYFGAILIFISATLWFVWRLIVPSRRARLRAREDKPSEAGLEARLQAAEVAGVVVTPVRTELSKLEERRARGKVYIAFFGEISSGKSSLIKAFLNAESTPPTTHVRGGATRRVEEFSAARYPGWVFVDVPGLNEAAGTLDTLAIEEARRAHLVVYVCDDDLKRDDYEQVKFLASMEKPVLVALNKSDQYKPDQLQLVTQKITERLENLRTRDKIKSAIVVVPVSAQSHEEVVLIDEQGHEQRVERATTSDTEALENAMRSLMQRRSKQLDTLRDSAVVTLAADKLDTAEEDYRQVESAKIVQQYTKKAVIGAMAAIAPGTDILIQGVLATGLVREMCALYDAPIKDLDVQKFLKQAQSKIGKAVPVILAVSGNALKAFPGIGTVAGGLAHAVAYGLAFDALGKSLAITLAEGRGFNTTHTTQVLQESLNNDLEARTKRIASLVKALRTDTD